MNIFQALQTLVTVMEENTDDKTMYAATKAFMEKIPDHRNKHSVLECLNYIATNVNYHLCKHPSTTSVHHLPECNGDDYEIHTCTICGIQRYVWYDLVNEGYDQYSCSKTFGKWEYDIDKK